MKKCMFRLLKVFYLLVLLFILSPIFDSKTVFALTQDNQVNESILVLKNDEHIEHIKQELSTKFSSITIQTSPEIKTMKISYQSMDLKRQVEEFLKTHYKSEIEAVGDEVNFSSHPTKGYPIETLNRSFNTKYLSEQPSKSIDLYKLQWDISSVTNNKKSFQIQTGNHDVKIALIDSGIDFLHPDLEKNIIDKGKSFVPGINDTQDNLGHGTMVAGSIIANGNLVGVGPDLGLIPYKVMDDDNGESYWVVSAIIQAVKDKVDVINLSLGVYKSIINKEDEAVIKAYENAVKYANENGVLLVASAGSNGFNIGNPKILAEQRGMSGDEQIHMPGGLSGVVTVAATTKEKTLASYTNYGMNVRLGAPGGDYGFDFLNTRTYDLGYMVLTTYPTTLPQSQISSMVGLPKGYEFTAGSSIAAPKASATAGLIIAQYEKVHGKKPTIKETTQLLMKGAFKNGFAGKDKEAHSGIINAYESLLFIK